MLTILRYVVQATLFQATFTFYSSRNRKLSQRYCTKFLDRNSRRRCKENNLLTGKVANVYDLREHKSIHWILGPTTEQVETREARWVGARRRRSRARFTTCTCWHQGSTSKTAWRPLYKVKMESWDIFFGSDFAYYPNTLCCSQLFNSTLNYLIKFSYIVI